MPGTAQPDYSPESKVILLPASVLVDMKEGGSDYVDQKGLLGLGTGDLIDLKLPRFQRGLKWNDEKLSNFHDSVVQGWPIGVLVIVVQESWIINDETGQRRFTLSLIDGQQRAWALTKLLREFWTAPWIEFQSEKWLSAEPAAGAIVDADAALNGLSLLLTTHRQDLEEAVIRVCRSQGREAFELHTDFLAALDQEMTSLFPDTWAGAPNLQDKAVQKGANDLCRALRGGRTR